MDNYVNYGFMCISLKICEIMLISTFVLLLNKKQLQFSNQKQELHELRKKDEKNKS
jgi:hypothetical protein